MKTKTSKNTLKVFFIISVLFLNQTFSQEWKPIKLGAGGWLTGMVIHPSGSPVYARSDQNNLWRWDENRKIWDRLITTETMPSEEIDQYKYLGVLSVATAASDKNLVYMAYKNSIFKSTNQGDTWVNTNFPTKDNPRGTTYMNPNITESKLAGERLVVDPVNNDVVYFGSFDDGLYRTTDGGNSWNVVAGVPSGAAGLGIRQVLFDPTGGNTNGKTNVIYMDIDGVGVYKSINAGNSWINITSGSDFDTTVRFTDMEVSANGLLYVSAFGSGCKVYNKTSWRDFTPPGQTNIAEIAIDPFDNNRVLLKGLGNQPFFRTLNASDATPTWTSMLWDISKSDIPWFKFDDLPWVSEGEIMFDPAVKDRLWMCEGIGSWRTSDVNDDTISLEGTSNGQEHMVNNDIAVVENGNVIVALWDRPIFVKKPENFDQYADKYYPSDRFNSAWSLATTPANKNFVAAIIEDHRYCCYDEEHRNSGYSMDGGETWTRFETFPENNNVNSIFGNIAVAANSIDNIVWMPSFNKPIQYTEDRGKTWQVANMPDITESCCLHAEYIQKQVLVADKVAPNTFYVYDWGDGKIHKSTDGGANWSAQGSVPEGGWHAKLLAVDGEEGNLLFSSGQNGDRDSHGIMMTTDGGLTWTEMTNTDKVGSIAVGKAVPNSDYPTIFISGEVNNVLGYHMSTDKGESWKKIGDTYPFNDYAYARVMTGDPFKYGRLYIAQSSNGVLYIDADGTNNCPAANTTCDDGNPNTEDDVEDGNCNCSGTPIIDNTTDEEMCIVDTELTIDGYANDWSEKIIPVSNVILGSVNSTEDLSASFQTQWDENYLYVLIDVKDDILINDSENSYEDDSVEIYIDGGNEKATVYDSNDHQLVFSYGSDIVSYFPANQSNPNGVSFAQRETDSGYVTEAKIAWSFIGITPPSLDHAIGIEIMVNDDDAGGNRTEKIAWNSTENIAYTDTSVFGEFLTTSCLGTPTNEEMCIVDTELTIDGYANDWSEKIIPVSNVILGSVNSAEDLSASFQTQWDENYLYVLIDVKDDILINDSENSYEDDSVEIYIDGGNEKATVYDSNDHQLVFSYGSDIVSYFPANQSNPNGVSFAQRETDSGYVTEAKIAWSFIGITPPSLDHAIGIEIMVNDDDAGGNRTEKIAWNSTENIAYADTSVFGEFLIGDCKSPKQLFNLETTIRLYPNPTEDQLYVDFPVEAGENYTIKIIDVTGKLVQTYSVKGRSNIIDISKLQSDLYFITFTSGTKYFTTKFLKN